ncbi:MAG: cation:proton antiporter [Myxococcales bacterium]|nr:cation:proton antiporter [Myxococcales bacterium]USN50945.1 MAG: cation:proton antiporter [Myxococcales bacterium]
MPNSADHSYELIQMMSHIFLFSAVAGILVPLLQRIRLSPVLGYLVCGIAIGPYGLARLSSDNSWFKYLSVSDTSSVSILGEFGIIALMFVIGLELSLRRLQELKLYVFGLGSTQIIFSGTLIFLVVYALGNNAYTSILLGTSLALSSTAIVMQLLAEKRLNHQKVGTMCFSVLLMQDLAVVPILVLVSSFAPEAGQQTLYLLFGSILVAICAIVFIYVMGRWLLRPLLNLVSNARNPEWLSSFVLLMVASCASITILAGLSGALGAFLAGLLIAETEFRYEVEVIISPLKSLLLGVFFMSIGMIIDLWKIVTHPVLLFSWVIGLFIIKAFTIFITARLFKIIKEKAMKLALYLAQPGEFAFMVISVALAAKIIDPEQGQFFLLVTALSMFLTPIIFELTPFITRGLAATDDVIQKNSYLEKIVILAGFGRIGQILGTILQEQGIPFVALEYDSQKVRFWQKRGFPVIYGDAKNIELWRLVHADTALAAVITIDEKHSAKTIVSSIQTKWPKLPIILRANDIKDIDPLHELGAKYVVPETLELSLRIARILMSELGLEHDRIDKALEQTWQRSCYPRSVF